MVYLLHFSGVLGGHAQHYIGYTQNLDQRLEQHKQGYAGSAIMRAVKDAGLTFECVRTWTGDRKTERKLKNFKNSRKLCPVCNEHVIGGKYDNVGN